MLKYAAAASVGALVAVLINRRALKQRSNAQPTQGSSNQAEAKCKEQAQRASDAAVKALPQHMRSLIGDSHYNHFYEVCMKGAA